MASNSFGTIFRITTWGESHGRAVGVVLDGCPAGLSLDAEEIHQELKKRAPGIHPCVSSRQEIDYPEIFSGVWEGQTTGAPISIVIFNQDQDPKPYEEMKEVLRPGHASFTYLEKYGLLDYRGGGRASARETVCRVAAGAVAKKILQHEGIELLAYLEQVGPLQIRERPAFATLKENRAQSPIFCPDLLLSEKIVEHILQVQKAGDSVGGRVAFTTSPLPVGLGDPVYEKLEANLAKAMLSIPASKAFEMGSGAAASSMQGSEHNDLLFVEGEKISFSTNHAGGVLGGITNGMPLWGAVSFKPPSSIGLPQVTLTVQKEEILWKLPPGSRHDPCVAIRAVPVVEAMLALVLVDAILLNRCACL